MALPREAHESNNSNELPKGLGDKRVIDLQVVSEWLPKPSRHEFERTADLLGTCHPQITGTGTRRASQRRSHPASLPVGA
jgi:hypothetical protein